MRWRVKEVLALLQSFGNYLPQEGLFSQKGEKIALVVGEVEDASSFQGVVARAKESLKGRDLEGVLFLLQDKGKSYRLGYLEKVSPRGGKERFLARGALYLPGRENRVLQEAVGLLRGWRDGGKPLTLGLLREAFSPERVVLGFHRGMERAFREAAQEVRGLGEGESQGFLLSLVLRLLFLAFAAKRGWLGDREDFLPWLLERYRAEGLWGKDRFYPDWLHPLLFGARGRDGMELGPLGELLAHGPEAGEGKARLSDRGVEKLFRFLFGYNLTPEENTAYEVDLEPNPEFLGLVLERLLNTAGVEGKGSELGAHYTPKAEVDLMVRLGLAELLGRRGLPLEKAYALMGGKAEPLEDGERALAREVLLGAKVLDPAVGSGAFLVGALQVLEETLDLLGEPRTPERRGRLMGNLYGVDAFSWAVWVTRLRFWLACPCPGPKVAHGDGVVQRLGPWAIPVRLGEEAREEGEVLSQLLEARRGGAPEGEVRRLEGEFLVRLIRKRHGKGLQGGLLLEGEKERFEEELETLRKDIEAGKRPFLYLVDFAEVLAGGGGFDLVIGNPPYVRHEEIGDPLERYRKEDYKAYLLEEVLEEVRSLSGMARGIEISGRSDLYAYFYPRTLALLNPRGVHVFLASSSWLDARYGAWLQEVFLSGVPLRFVVENRAERSFGAEVHAAITVAWAPSPVDPEWKVRFLALELPFEEVDLLGSLRGLWEEERWKGDT